MNGGGGCVMCGGRVCDVWRVCDEWRGGCVMCREGVMCGGCVMSGGEGVWCVEEGWCMEECVENKLNMAMPVTSSLSPSPLLPSPLSFSHRELRQLSSMWTREQEEELAELYERFKEEGEGKSQL